ncbi:hypothetical protein M8J75_005605 [Diaphorina citri]|nr:hypothetical protein M8J75_005605 [Diaphorina citri]
MTNSKHSRVEMVVPKEANKMRHLKSPNSESQCQRPTRSARESPHSHHSLSNRSSPIKINNPVNSHRSRESYSQSPSPTFGIFYAGAKFSEPPAPHFLPKPPCSWTYTNGCHPVRETQALRMLLKVEA